MVMLRNLLLGAALVAAASAFWATDENKYIKKFAMMKVYESCFGDEVVREVREEMRAAAARCAAQAQGGSPSQQQPAAAVFAHLENTVPQTTMPPAPSTTTEEPTSYRPVEPTRRPPMLTATAAGSETLLRLQALLSGLKNFMSGGSGSQHGGAHIAAAAAGISSAFGGGGAAPVSAPQALPPAQQHPIYQHQQQHQQTQQRYPYPAADGYGPYYAPPAPYYYPPAPAYYPFQHNPFAPFYNPRTSRDMGLSGASGPGKARNITCVMQELGYLDANLQPNFSGIISRIQRLPLPDELKSDMTDAVEFCQRFSQCVPEPDENKMQVSAEFTKPMLFFKCYKQKKLEACVLKDVRDRFLLAAPGDPEMANGLDDEDNAAAPPPGAVRGAYRGRSSRVMRKPRPATPATSTASPDLAELVFSDAFAL